MTETVAVEPAEVREPAQTATRVVPGDGLVQIAYLHPHVVSHSWHESMMRLVGYDAANEGRVVGTVGPYMIRCDAGGLVESRNLAATRFLDETDHEWLWFIDTDMGFLPDTVDRLVDAADPVERPVVGALCFGLREVAYDGYGGQRTMPVPTLFRHAKTPEGHVGFTNRWDYPADTVVQVAGTGAACLLIHRTVLEKTRAEFGDTWFDPVRYGDGRRVSEDLSFCAKLGASGIPVFVHTGVKTTHHKQFWVADEDYLRFVAPPPATEEAAVIVPVMRRPQNAAPFMASLRASTGLATAYAICDADDGDTIEAWRAAGARTIIRQYTTKSTRPGTFAEKCNTGYRNTSEPWLLLVGDDVRFHPGWLDHTQVRGQVAAVVGTNDLANPRTITGHHSCHPMIRRSYIDEHGASWDGPGVVCHEGYRHGGVDLEIAAVAKARGQWAFAYEAKVEHLHPQVGAKGEYDDVYKRGESTVVRDRELYKKRLAEHAP